MLPLNITENQFVVSLDSLDLSFLRRYVEKPTEEKKLLWSKPSLDGESAYYQVTISEDNQNEDPYTEPCETYTCHICNIDVPQAYSKQHIQSKRHQSFKKLTERVLENISKQINVDIDSMNSTDEINKYYCEICSKIVLRKNKRKHNRSNHHRQSIENEKVTDNFMEIFIEKKITIKSETETENKTESNNNDENKKDENKRDLEHNNSSETIRMRESDGKNKPIKSDTQVVPNYLVNNGFETPNAIDSDDESVECDSNLLSPDALVNDIAYFQKYLKEMIEKYKLKFEIPTVEDNLIVIKTSKGQQAKITINTFHGYNKVHSFVFCQLCKAWVDLNIIDHSSTEEHVRNITQPINDNFARVLVQNIRWSHCLICNEMVITGSNHAALSPNHKKYNEVITSTAKAIPPKRDLIPKQTFCDVCKLYIDTHNFSSHANSKKHKSNKNSKEVNPGPANTAAQSAVKNKELYCDICKVNVPQGGMAIHEAGKPHITKRVQKAEAALEKINADLQKLAIGNNVPTTSKASNPPQKNSAKPPTMEEKLFEYNKQMADFSETEVECLVCDLRVPILDRNIIEHVEGFRHRKAVENLLSDHKIVQKSIKLYYCELCNMYIDDFIDHINENVNHNVKDILSKDIDKKELRKYMYDDPSNRDALAVAYRKVHVKLLAQNKIVRLNASSCYCHVCKVSLSRTTEIDHMFGERHKSCLN